MMVIKRGREEGRKGGREGWRAYRQGVDGNGLFRRDVGTVLQVVVLTLL